MENSTTADVTAKDIEDVAKEFVATHGVDAAVNIASSLIAKSSGKSIDSAEWLASLTPDEFDAIMAARTAVIEQKALKNAESAADQVQILRLAMAFIMSLAVGEVKAKLG